jgi:amino acid adenylation domain-containing protein
MLVQDFLQQSAQRFPQKIALVCEGKRLSYAALDAMSNRLAHGLCENGIKRGDRVALFLPNSIALAAGIFAVLKAGAVFVPINHTTKRDKLLYVLNNCRASAFLTDESGAAQACAFRLKLDVPSLKCIVIEGGGPNDAGPDSLDFLEIQTSSSDASPACQNGADDLACLIYTSGSTGDPKGVMSDHSNVVFASGSIIQYLENTENDIVLNALPLSFDYGLYQMLMTFRFGGTLILENSFAFPAAILKRMEEERVTGFPGVPTMFAMLLRQDLSLYDLSSLRYITNTAAALSPTHIEEIRRKFHWAKLFSMYGLTETKRTLYLPPEELQKRPGSVGIPIPGTEAWLEDESGKRLGAGEIGELIVRGPHVMRGYWESPEATAQRFQTGEHGERICRSGDLFRMDEEGYFYFVGRKDDIIKSRGEKVSPKEIENVLYALDGVLEAAVIGVPDAVLGQAIKAIIVTNGVHLSQSQVLAHCRAHVEDFMVPRQIEFRDSLPKTTSGKIKKTGLK